MDNPLILIGALILIAVLIVVLLRGRRKQQETETVSVKSPPQPSRVVASGSEVSTGRRPVVSDDVKIEKTFEFSDAGWESGQAAEISVAQVDDLTEYKVYKQFGYFDKAAQSLSSYLMLHDDKPKELVFELCGLYLEAGKLDDCVQTLESYRTLFSREELEDVVKMGFELEPNNLNLRVFAEEQLGWGVEEVAKYIVKEDSMDLPVLDQPVIEEAIENTFQSSKQRARTAYFSRLDNAKQLVQGFKRIFGISAEERETIIAFSSEEKAARLLGKEIDYIPATNLYARAFLQAKRPAGLIIDALNLDFRQQHIDNYAEHLWHLYSVLGKYGRLVKERMLGWGYSLGPHPLFGELEQTPDEIRLREIGIQYGYVSDSASNVKAKMLPLVTENIEQKAKYATNEVDEVLQEAEAQLMYGQVEEAMDTLEKGVFAHMNEPQLYSMLLDLYERSESWHRFEDFSVKVRSQGVDLPEEVVVALSHLTQRMNERVAR